MAIRERLLTAVISAIVFSLFVSCLNYTPIAEQQEAIGYWSYRELVFAFIMYSLPVFLTGGILFSLLADWIIGKIQWKSKFYTYIGSIIVYGAGGVVVNIFFYMSILEEEATYLLLLGVLASFTFLHVMLLTRKILQFIRR